MRREEGREYGWRKGFRRGREGGGGGGVKRDYLFTHYLSVEVENSSGHVVKRKKIGVSCQRRG